MEPEQAANAKRIDLIRKIMFASGILCSIAGLFVLLFVNRIAGVAFIIAGFSDLVFSYFLPKLIESQSGNGGQ